MREREGGVGEGEGEEVKEGEGVVLLIRRVGLPHEGGSLPQGVERREKEGKEEGEVMILVETEETTT